MSAVGNLIAHIGPNSFSPQPVTPELIANNKQAVPLDSNQLPAEISLIEALTQ